MNQNVIYGIGGLLLAGGIWWKFNPSKKWILNGDSLTAEQLKNKGFVPYGDNNWIPASYLNGQLGTSIDVTGFVKIIKSGVGLFQKITEAIADLKNKHEGKIPGTGNEPCAIFGGQSQGC